MKCRWFPLAVIGLLAWIAVPAYSQTDTLKDNVYNPGILKPVDSTLNVQTGQPAPGFTLPSLSGEKISRRAVGVAGRCTSHRA